MFKKKTAEQPVTEATGYIGSGTYIEGKVRYNGTLRIDGHFKGEIESEGFLIVGERGKAEGVMKIDNALLCGEVRGSVIGKDKIELRSPGRIYADIQAPTIIMGEGVLFEGSCVMVKKPGTGPKEPVEISTDYDGKKK
ncbi:MAG: polymer-forming cytoskeletal protein [Deltaproteobacteria bacterium]|nr:polymer-forming cytoskeletal protein [Deltaproteobacteria bacterium]